MESNHWLTSSFTLQRCIAEEEFEPFNDCWDMLALDREQSVSLIQQLKQERKYIKKRKIQPITYDSTMRPCSLYSFATTSKIGMTK